MMMKQTKEQIRHLLEKAFCAAFSQAAPEEIPVKAQLRDGLGVFSSSLPFTAAKSARTSPLSAARRILEQLEKNALFEEVKAQSGYLNFVPSALWYAAVMEKTAEPVAFSPIYTEEDLALDAASPTDREVLTAFLRLCSRLRHLRFLGLFEGEVEFQRQCSDREKMLLFQFSRLAENTDSYPALTEGAQAVQEVLSQPLPEDPDEAKRLAHLLLWAGGQMKKAIPAQKIAKI